jgi:hypothetical protein
LSAGVDGTALLDASRAYLSSFLGRLRLHVTIRWFAGCAAELGTGLTPDAGGFAS